ncbi:MAG TPA: molybdopterin molybdotransferase MoeA, partial [Phenylobacterium sp.]
MIGYDDAVEAIRSLADPLESESVELDEADARVLAAPIVAGRASPPVTVSAMDGYAVRDADLAATPVRLKVLGESFAGQGYVGSLEPGGCVRIFTGAPAPVGADRIVVQEVVCREGGVALMTERPTGARHIRAAASDFAAGDVLVNAGVMLDPQKLVAAAAADLSAVRVVRRPKLLVLSTGDELRAPGSNGVSVGGVPESVSFGVAALARRWGAQVEGRRRLPDDLERLEAAAAEALGACDLLVVTGGASVGDRDFAKPMFQRRGLELVFSKVAIKPGKPVWLGRADGTLVLGLPGNPTAAMVTARLFLAPLVAGL